MVVSAYIKRILKIGILGLSIFYIFSLLWLFSKRLVYPYELDWIEGGMLTSVIQILDGHNLYSAPSIVYVPFLYAPVFFYIAAFFAKFWGTTLLALRLVSALATLVSLLTIVLIVFGETKSWLWGIASAGLFAGLYPASRFWFDLARVDSVFLMFFLLFLFSLRRGDSVFWQIAAGVFASITILTKQNGMTMCLPIMAMYFVLDWKHRLILPCIFALLFGGISLAFIFSSDGWYIYYSYSMAFLKPNVRTSYSVFDFIQSFVVDQTTLAALFSLAIFPLWFLVRKAKEPLLLWLFIFISTITTSYLAKANIGGVNNVVIPTFAVFSILFGVFLFEVIKELQKLSYRHHVMAEICFCLLAFFQLMNIFYIPSVYVPSLEDYRSGAKALKFVEKFDGNVYLPNSSVLLIAGKSTFAHPSAIWDVMNTDGNSQAKAILGQELKTAVHTHLFDAIAVLPTFNYFPDLRNDYAHDTAIYILLDDNWKEKTNVYILPK